MTTRLIFFLLLIIPAIPSRSEDWKDVLVKQAASKFKRLESFNTHNIATGEAFKNIYVIELDKNWVEERPDKIILSKNYESLALLLRDFNNQRKDNLRFYVIVVNNYEAILDETVDEKSLGSRIDRLDDVVKLPSLQEQYVRYRYEIGSIPQEIINALNIYDERIVYFYGRIKLFKLGGKPHIYKHDNLSLVGKKLESSDDEIRTRAKSGITTQSVGDKIEKIAANIINAVQLIIDGHGVGSPEIRCDQNLEDIAASTRDIREREYSDAVKSTVELLDNPSTAQRKNSQYFLVDKPEDFPDDNVFNHTVIPDKLDLLANPQHSRYTLYLVFKKVNFAIPHAGTSEFAEEVYKKSGAASRSNTIVMVVPYLNSSCSGTNWLGLTSTKGTAILMPSVYSNDENLNSKMNAALSLQGISWEAAFNQAFSHIPKNHYEYKYAISYDFIAKRYGTVVQSDVTGHDRIFDLEILVDNRLQTHVDAKLAIKRQMDSKEPLPSVLQSNRTVLESLPSQDGSAYLLKHGLKESALAKLAGGGAEVYSPAADQFVKWFVAGKAAESEGSGWSSLAYSLDGSVNSPPDNSFLKGVNPVVLESYFSALDAVGIALNFAELDWITDGAGFLIASYYHDTDNKILYGVSIAVPVSAIVIRTSVKKARALKKTLGGEWELVEESIDLASSSKWFDLLPAQLKVDIGDVNSELGQLFTKASDPKRTELVEAWMKLNAAGVDQVVRKNGAWLDRVSGWKNEGLELTSEGKILREGSEVGQILGDRLHVKYMGYGGEIVCHPDKTTTLLGKWKDPACGGTCEIIDSRLSKSGENTGGVNVLSENIPSGWTDQEIWDKVNEPWLRDAANRGDVIRVVSDPLLGLNIFKEFSSLPIPKSVFDTPSNLADYLKNLSDPDILNKLSFFGREVKWLSENNYLFDASNHKFVQL
jgi:hypothetical protein